MRELRLWGFGANGSHPTLDEAQAGLDISALPQLAPTLRVLELVRCGIAPCAPGVLESLVGLQVRRIPRVQAAADVQWGREVIS